MGATGQGVRQLTTGQLAGLELPDWSPDGQHIAYIAGDRLWVMGVDASSPKQLTQAPGTDYAPAWSPKGNEIVYRHLEDNGDGSLRIVNVQTGQIRAVPTGGPGTPLAPAWGSAAS